MIEHEKDSRIEMIQLALLALCVGIIHHILFYKQALGISYPIFVGVLYAYLFWGLRNRVRRGLDMDCIALVNFFNVCERIIASIEFSAHSLAYCGANDAYGGGQATIMAYASIYRRSKQANHRFRFRQDASAVTSIH
jgi:hypothetical protein